LRKFEWVLADRASQIQGGMKNWRLSTNISLYFENGTRYGHSYNGRRINSYAIYRMMPFPTTFSDP